MDLKSTGSADSHVIRYRADVDGLRAVAVLAVVFYHFSRTALPGGYLGVDMFFVISGFLITSIIWREVQGREFSIVRFYDRRIRRIMPALLLLLVPVTVAAVVLLLPADLVGYGRSLLATLAFVANIYFWRDTNYFSRAAEEKPLLHLWSLGVEEQFYILFPLLLALLARFWPRGAIPVIATLAVGSFALNVFALMIGADSPAFFLLPTRAWELGLGALLAVLPARAFPRGTVAAVLAAFGAVLVVGGLLHPPQSLPFLPVALPAVVGVGLLIMAGQQGTPMMSRLLTLRPVVFVGLISYSLYLWHWPIIVFGQYYLVREFNLVETLAALVLMFACATASLRFVERPFRSSKMPIRTVRYVALAGVVALAAAAATLLWARGFPGRLSAEAAVINSAVGTNYRCPVSEYIALGASRACLMNLPSRDPKDADVVLLGNSHAQMYAPAWETIITRRRQTGLLVPFNACLPTVQANISVPCLEVARNNLAELAKLQRARTVILGFNWDQSVGGFVDAAGRAVRNDDSRALIAALDDLISRLQQAGKHVVLIGPIAEPGWDVASIVSRQLAFGHPFDRPHFTPVAEFRRRYGSAIQHFEARPDIGFARPDRVQCGAERCDYLLDGHSLFSDHNHVAAPELHRFIDIFEAALPPP